jgi:hypothetical protein
MQVNIKRGEQIELTVGTRVEFTIGEEVHTDTISYIEDGTIEGEKYDLSYVRFRVVS